jgi:hypothetical protein
MMRFFRRRGRGAPGPTIGEILHGLTPGRMQSVGLMQVIPLLIDPALEDERFVPPDHALVGTVGYGQMEFDNQSARTLLVPSHATYIVNARVQDHALPSGGFVKGNARKTFNRAMCVQQSQPGLIQIGEHQLAILPLGLRETALRGRNDDAYNRLWDAIAAFNKSGGVTAHGNLIHFLDHYQQELERFVAEFECLPEQCGAAVLIDGEVVGIERAPSRGYWRAVWEPLIRTCYGAHAIIVGRRKGDAPPPPDTRVALDTTGAQTLDDLADAVAKAAAEEERIARETLRNLLGERFELEEDDTAPEAGVRLETVSNGQFVGQIVREAERVLYASLVTSTEWMKERAWGQAPGFEV